MKYFLIAGEASGDLHGSNLMKALKEKDPHAEFRFWGGDLMAHQAPNGLLVHFKDVTLMGFVEVVMNLKSIFSNLNLCKKQLLEFEPDVVVFIDYPGFNLRIAEFCKQKHIKTAYYISPKIWAWKENRGKKLEKFVDELMLIFPFEVAYFKKWTVKTHYVGNPLIDAIADYQTNHQPTRLTKDPRPIIALLPGSRKQEIDKILPIMLNVVPHYPAYQFIIAGAPGQNQSAYEPYLSKDVTLVFGQTYHLLSQSQAAVVCSGTATLETALFRVPQVCGYVANAISVAIARLLVKIKYISLVNLCLNKDSIVELIQHDFNPTRIKAELDAVLPGGKRNPTLLADYEQLQDMLGGPGASNRAANVVYTLSKKQ